jgi:hypothetical protein
VVVYCFYKILSDGRSISLHLDILARRRVAGSTLLEESTIPNLSAARGASLGIFDQVIVHTCQHDGARLFLVAPKSSRRLRMNHLTRNLANKLAVSPLQTKRP